MFHSIAIWTIPTILHVRSIGLQCINALSQPFAYVGWFLRSVCLSTVVSITCSHNMDTSLLKVLTLLTPSFSAVKYGKAFIRVNTRPLIGSGCILCIIKSTKKTHFYMYSNVIEVRHFISLSVYFCCSWKYRQKQTEMKGRISIILYAFMIFILNCKHWRLHW